MLPFKNKVADEKKLVQSGKFSSVILFLEGCTQNFSFQKKIVKWKQVHNKIWYAKASDLKNLKSIKFNLKYFVALVPVKSMVALKVMKHLMNMMTMMTMVKTMTIMILSESTMEMKTVVIKMVIKMVKMGMVQQQQQGMKKQLQREQLRQEQQQLEQLQQEQLQQGQLQQGQLRRGQLQQGQLKQGQLKQERLQQAQLQQGQLQQGQLHLGIAEGRGLLHPPLPVKRPRLQPYLKGQMLQIPCLAFQWYYIQTKLNMARL